MHAYGTWLLLGVAACGRIGFDSSSSAADASPLDTVDALVDASPDATGFQCGDKVDSGAGLVESRAFGAQCWLGENLAIGTTVSGTTTPSNNGVAERVCFNNVLTNCALRGGLYEWNEAMAYATAERSRGICPPSWHIPSDAEWMTLERTLGMSVTASMGFGYRGAQDVAFEAASPGFGARFVGIRTDSITFFGDTTEAFFWSSTEVLAGANGISRRVTQGIGGIDRTGYAKRNAMSVRCVHD